MDYSEGWRRVLSPYYDWGPPRNKLIQIMREEWDAPVTLYAHEIHPEMNSFGLYWRLTGIGKEQA